MKRLALLILALVWGCKIVDEIWYRYARVQCDTGKKG